MDKRLEELSKQIELCTRCPLRQNSTAPVPGIGEGRRYLVLGEACGAQEDKAGIPFIGLSGKRLNQLLELAGINLKDCFITNVCKCLPPKVSGKRRAPRKAERLSCYGWLQQELSIIKPTYIIALGATPASLFTDYGISQIHGTMAQTEIPLADEQTHKCTVIFHYHPAASLHQPRLLAVMLDDWENMPEVVPHDYTVTAPSIVKSSASMIALDTETDNKGGVGQWSIAYRNSKGQLEVQSAYGQTKIIYPDEQKVCFHNARYDIRELERNKFATPKPENVLDTMVMSYVLGFGRQKPEDTGKVGDNMVGGLGLKYLARRHLGMEMKTWQEVHERPDLVPEYNANDSVATLLLAEKWIPQLPQHFWDIDMPLLDVLMKMEDRGIKVDPDFIKKYAEEIDVHLDEVKKELGDLNPYATEQVADYIYGTLGYPVTQKTSTGKPQVTKEILETIDDPIVRRILEYKGFYQEKKTYISNYVKGMDLDGRVHCEFKQTSTSTGRLSAARPNLQNVVKEKTDKSKSRIRDLFIAPKGMLLVRVDWQQLELRVFAALTQDEHMLKALLGGEDIHQITADMLGVSRDDAKINNFLTLYGGTPWAISREFHIPIDKAKRFQKDYYEKFPGVKKYMAQQRELAETEKKVYNHYGRVCRLDGMFSDEWKVREDAIRLGINMPIQGTAGEVVKRAMIDLHYQHSAPLLINIHDELLFEIPERDAKDYALWLKEYLPALTTINDINFPVDASVGKTWLEASKKEAKI